MTTARLVAVLFAVVACVAFVACGDNDSAKPTTTPTHRATPTHTVEPSPDNKATPIEETPVETEQPGSETPTPPSPAEGGIRAKLVPDEAAYLAQFRGRDVQEQMCQYDPVTRLTDCNTFKYSIDPPFIAQDIECFLGIVDGQPEYIRCTSVEPEQTMVYEIQRER